MIFLGTIEIMTNELDDSAINLIKEILKSTIDKDCLSRDNLFELCGGEDILKMEVHVFRVLLSGAVKAGRLPGYLIRAGRGGGVCCSGNYEERSVTFSKDEIDWMLHQFQGLTKHNIARKVISKLRKPT
jgi:hypothetical protein